MVDVGLVLSSVLVIIISILWKVFMDVAWKPYVVTKYFRKQGINGPKYKLWSGSSEEMKSIRKDSKQIILDTSSHDITGRVVPFYAKWIDQYGEILLYWFGSTPRLCISDPEMVKQVLSNKFGYYGKTDPVPSLLALLGKWGLVLTEGSDWVKHRRVLNPAFSKDKLKMMTKTMAECAMEMIEQWQVQVSEGKEIDVSKQFQELTADVISHTAFGSSYKQGKEVFLAQKELQVLIAETLLTVNFPWSKYVPNKRNKSIWKLEKKVQSMLMEIVQRRLDSRDSGFGHDLLGLMMEASEKQDGQMMNMNEIMDECKTFFFAGHETTSHLLTWAIFLLSTNQDWQKKLRDEVFQECGQEIPTADMLGKLKMVNMVLLETLRLYGPVVLMARKATKDMTLRGLNILKDTEIFIPIAIIHRRKDIWSDDANEFNPLRFENGITKAAKHPNALIAFSIGPRACIGQDFAIMEAKLVLSMILQKFSFILSPDYKHTPIDVLTLHPQYGLPIYFNPLNA